MPNILVNLPDPLLASLDALAAERAEPGMKPNRTEAVRYLIREHEARLHAAVCRPATNRFERETDHSGPNAVIAPKRPRTTSTKDKP
jgi:hypothetical protein